MRWLAIALLLTQSVGQQPPTFRAGTVLVPVDVRVVDRDGNPVRDLRRDDFTVVEDRIPQEIAHFSTHEYDERTSAAAAGLSQSTSSSPALSAPTHRTFVFVLGRGRLRGPSKGIQALVEFVRTGLRPGDRLAVVAYDRITHVTADREGIIRLLQHYDAHHEELEALLDHWYSSLLVGYVSRDHAPPVNLQRRIDEFVGAPGLPSFRHLLSMPPEMAGQLEVDRRTALDRNQDGTSAFVNFASTAQDLEKLHATIDYLRLLDGEKHVIFLTEEGLHGAPRGEYAQVLARVAADARVTVSTIHTAGLPVSWARDGNRVWIEGPTWQQRWAYADSRTIAQRTGGLASVFDYAAPALDRVERSTRFTYLLGYHPKSSNWDGKPRRIEVKVNRKNVTVLYRHEYYARKESRPYDYRERLTEARIAGARNYRSAVTDIPLKLAATLKENRGGKTKVDVQLTVDASRVRFSESDGRHAASIEIALFVAAGSGRQIGTVRKRIDLKLTPANYEALRRDGIAFAAVVDASDRARYVKAVVYDYTADRVGSAGAEVK